MLKEIKKTEIPNWKYGDLCIKTYSYGDLLTIKDMGDIKDDEIIAKPGFKGSDIGLMMLAAGLHYVRTEDGTDFILKPNEDKKKFCYDLDSEISFYLLKEINKLNAPITDQEKK